MLLQRLIIVEVLCLTVLQTWATQQSAGSSLWTNTFRAVALNLWVVTPWGCQISCISDIYIAVHHSSNITVMKQERNNFMVGCHNRNCIKGCSIENHSQVLCQKIQLSVFRERRRQAGVCSVCPVSMASMTCLPGTQTPVQPSRLGVLCSLLYCLFLLPRLSCHPRCCFQRTQFKHSIYIILLRLTSLGHNPEAM